MRDALQGFGIDQQIGQGVESSNRMLIANARPLNAQFLSLTVDAFTTGSLSRRSPYREEWTDQE